MKFLKISSLFLITAVAFTSCVKQNFSAPPDTSGLDPNLPVTTSLKTFAKMGLAMTSGQYRTLGDTTISGIVIADDKTGNFYKQIVIEDTSGYGITLGLDKTLIYGDFPIGRKVYVKTKGLVLVSNNGIPEIASTVTLNGTKATITGIPTALINNFVIKASYPNTITPKDVTPIQLLNNKNSYINTLVRITNVEFAPGSNNVIYAAPTSTGSFASDRYITDATKTTSLDMYNSAYATFQPGITPNGSGDLTCVVWVYNGSIQLEIRDTTDVVFPNPRF